MIKNQDKVPTYNLQDTIKIKVQPGLMIDNQHVL
jgi:hypothetical protein